MELLGSQARSFPQLPTTAFGVVLPVDDRTRRWPPEHAYPQFHSRRRDGTEACVHVVRSRACRGFYTPEQLDAWAPVVHDKQDWANRIAALRPFVATIEDRVAGYADLQDSGYIDH